jgi:hypothetical protein
MHKGYVVTFPVGGHYYNLCPVANNDNTSWVNFKEERLILAPRPLGDFHPNHSSAQNTEA